VEASDLTVESLAGILKLPFDGQGSA